MQKTDKKEFAKVAWIDIPVLDLDRAQEFYSGVLKARFRPRQANIPMAVFEHMNGTQSAALFMAENSQPSPQGAVIYWSVEGRIQDAQAKVEALGGQILRPIHEIQPFGFRAIVLDSEGNRMALHAETDQ